jgi:uncharacterized protein (DUF3820 family)
LPLSLHSLNEATCFANYCSPNKYLYLLNNYALTKEENTGDGELLLQLVKMEMPFGKYKGTILSSLPVTYLEWFSRKGFPKGKLGILLATMHEIKINGLDYLLTPLKK